MTGVRQDVAVKIFGSNIDTLAAPVSYTHLTLPTT